MTSKSEQRKLDEWLNGVKSKLPTDKQELLSKVFEGDEAREVATELYRGHLGQEEISRRMTEADRARKEFEAEQARFNQEKIAVQKWFNDELPKNERLAKQNAALKEAHDAIAAKLREYGVDENDLPKAGAVNASGVSGEDLDRIQRQMNQYGFLLNNALPQVLKRSLSVTTKAIKEGWDVDGGAIFEHALKSGVTPEAAFEELTREQRVEREAKRERELIEKAKEEGRREALARGSSPDHVTAPGPTSVSEHIRNIGAAPSAQRDRLEAALSAFDKLTPDGSMLPI